MLDLNKKMVVFNRKMVVVDRKIMVLNRMIKGNISMNIVSLFEKS